MNIDEVWAAIDDHRGRTADLLETLDDAEWQHPSLCHGWTVRDVAAHLTLQQIRAREAIAMLPLALRHPGGTNSLIHHSAIQKAAVPTERLIEEIRAMIGSRKHNLGLSPREPLVDILVHGQDIAIPLGRTLSASPEVAADAATHIASYGTGWKSKVFQKNRFSASHLCATDVAWSTGTGPEIRGPMLTLLLLLAGRDVDLGPLSGDGLTTARTTKPAPQHTPPA
ncbi:maleylpyruvate isomerase family mycothiol-dependent enzyme [Rhodococcus sp. SJ-2]